MPLSLQGVAPLLQVFDMPASVRFYRDALEFEVAQTSGPEPFDWAMLNGHGCTLMLNTAYEPHRRPHAPDPARVAAHRDTALYFFCRDVDEAYAHLVTAGVDVKPPEVTQYRFRALHVTDPDGYGLCFHWPLE